MEREITIETMSTTVKRLMADTARPMSYVEAQNEAAKIHGMRVPAATEVPVDARTANETFGQTAKRLMRDRNLSYVDAQNEAAKVRKNGEFAVPMQDTNPNATPPAPGEDGKAIQDLSTYVEGFGVPSVQASLLARSFLRQIREKVPGSPSITTKPITLPSGG